MGNKLDAAAPQPQAPEREDGERYALNALVWKRESTQEWVLEISGSINDTNFVVRHTEPLTTSPEDVAGLPSLYATPPAHGDGEGVAELLAKLPSLETMDAVDDDLRSGTRPCPLNNLTINDVKLLHRVLTTRPATEAQEARDARRYRWLRGPSVALEYLFEELPNEDGFRLLSGEELDAAVDAAMAARGEGNDA